MRHTINGWKLMQTKKTNNNKLLQKGNSVCCRLQYLRRLKKIEQSDIVTKTGVNKSTISLWFNGKVSPGPKNLRLLSDFFNCDYDWLAEGMGEPFTPIKHELAEGVDCFQRHKENKDLDNKLAKLQRTMFKQECGAVYFKDFFDFIADCYGEDQEGAEEFLTELYKTHANYRFWLEEKKQTGDNIYSGGQQKIAENGK